MMRSQRIRYFLNFLILCIILVMFFLVFQCKKDDVKIMKVSNDSISEISNTSATANATIIDIGEGIEQHGHCWSVSSEPTVISKDGMTENGPVSNTGAYSSILSGLAPATKYYVRAYVKNGETFVYGTDILPFTTLSISKPAVTTGTVSNVTESGATVTANLNSLGSGVSAVTQHGHCWSSETTTPVIDDNESKTSLGSRDTTGNYESILVGLSAGTLYYVRAYATNDAGTDYGDALYFTTNQLSSIPSVVTSAVMSVTSSSAICGGSIESDGGSEITAKGVCWDTELNPVVPGTGNYTDEGGGSGTFASEITGLTESTTYYVRAYATNSVGTAYGDHVSFTASDDINIPTVTTTSASSITATSAASGGNVTYDGGTAVTVRGVCWSTSETPTTSDDYTTDGSGTGGFTSNISGLTESTLYYVRAYATNSVGTAYGDQVSFTTLEDIAKPTVTTAVISDVTTTSAVGGGNVISDGGAAVTVRGVCWNTAGSPTLSDDHTTDGSGTGLFTSNISGLTHNTLYYIRAYATNSVGTDYGDQVSFTTVYDPCHGVTSFVYEGETYSTVVIGNQCWMAENLNVGNMIDVDQDQANNTTTEKYCYDNVASNCNTYGGIYMWNELMQYSPSDDGAIGTTQGICPSGWHIPTDAEWKTLEVELGMNPSELDSAGIWRGTDEGGKLKQEGTTLWDSPNEGATNESGFTALPSGGMVDKTFGGIGFNTFYWTATEYEDNPEIGAWYRYIDAANSGIFRTAGNKPNATVVRCIKD